MAEEKNSIGIIFSLIILVVLIIFINSLNMTALPKQILYFIWVILFFSWFIYIVKS